jgi:8-oxo-dGTP pyrophosphatase MutT (NUDIX family)
MRVFYAHEQFPDEITLTLYLMGPTPRTPEDGSSWRPEALQLLQELGFDGEVFIPERRDGKPADDYAAQLAWEEEAVHRSDRILVWLPRHIRCVPGLTTNSDWGNWTRQDPARLFFGAGADAPEIQYYAQKLQIPTFSTLRDLCRAAVADSGEPRHGGECQIPLHLWRTPSFRHWYGAHKQVGNTLCGARIEWVYRLKQRSVFYWALRVDLYVKAESRHKSNEVVLGRPDVAAVVLYHPRQDLLETEVVLVREFRSPARTPDGFVLELPSGSTSDDGRNPLAAAAAEVQEETGLVLDLEAVHQHEARQLVGPLAVHQASLFSVELSEAAMAEVRAREAAKACHGIAAETEQTYPCVRSVREMLDNPAVDWSTLGMICRVLHDRL